MHTDIEFLKELQHKLNTQETDTQASPRFWTIGDFKWMDCDAGNAERTIIHFPDAAESIELNEYFEDFAPNNFADEALEKLAEIKDGMFEEDEELLEWIHEHDEEEAFLAYESLEHYVVPNTLFFTKEEAKNHLKSNGHHYTKDAHTYAQTAIRSPEINQLLQILGTFDWDSVEVKDLTKKG